MQDSSVLRGLTIRVDNSVDPGQMASEKPTSGFTIFFKVGYILVHRVNLS